MNKNTHILTAAVMVVLLLLSSCNLTKRLGPREKLLNRTKVKIEGNKKGIDKSELEAVVKQKPNRGLIGNFFRFNLWFYNLYKSESDAKLKTTIGEAPVIYDSSLTRRSVKQLELLLDNKGYFKNEVLTDKKEKGKKKINVKYIVHPGPAFKMGEIKYDIPNKKIKAILRKDSALSKLREGENFNIDLLQDERIRITKLLKNHGYYFFNKEFIYYTADSSSTENHRIDLTLHIKQYTEKSSQDRDSLIVKDHETYRINDIYIRQDYMAQKNIQPDGDTVMYGKYHFIQQGKPAFKPKSLAQHIFLQKGDYYQLKNHELTYRRLSSLQNFSYINIRFEKTGANEKLLNCYISLSPMDNKSLSFETVGTNNAGNFGIEGNVGVHHRNIFHGAEKLSLMVGGKIEAQPVLTKEEESDEIINDLPFNTFEFGPEISLDFPKFLLPVNQKRFSKRSNPKTNFNIAYNFQHRPAYTRNLYRLSFGYHWNETQYKRHIVTPVLISSIKLDPSPAFAETLEELSDPATSSYNPFILNSYQDHLISSSKYSFIYSNQEIKKKKNFSYFRGNIEFAGNLINAYSIYADAPRNDQGNYTIFGIRFAQFIRPDIDFRHYFNYERSSLVLRLAPGVGIPYGNSATLPFEKSFYAGGANGIRAWRARDLGPGSLPDTLEDNIDRIGEMIIESNVEYRFDITEIIEGATFIDMGNIWTLSENVNRPGAEFRLNRLWHDLAIGVGAGIRLDFNFFIIRFDLGVPLKDPGTEDPENFKLDFSEPPLNIGIGYPF